MTSAVLARHRYSSYRHDLIISRVGVKIHQRIINRYRQMLLHQSLDFWIWATPLSALGCILLWAFHCLRLNILVAGLVLRYESDGRRNQSHRGHYIDRV